jgi:dihydrofolate reductase
MTVSFILAVADNHVMATSQTTKLPWNLPTDVKRFREITKNHSVIMGRKTFSAFDEPLPDRDNIVITRDQSFKANGAIVVTSLDAALEVAKGEEIFIIGGGQIFKEGMPRADKMYLTIVHTDPDGDILFEYDANEWIEESREDHKADAENNFDYSFVDLVRNR